MRYTSYRLPTGSTRSASHASALCAGLAGSSARAGSTARASAEQGASPPGPANAAPPSGVSSRQ